ncbi:MAG TPA: hypothetical protein VL976_08770 [Xanthobacteraceae bacterium]|nr:hypothetical protein [Xanthobacteraceae bacterium]
MDQIIAQREILGVQRALKMRPVGKVQSDRLGVSRAFDPAIGSGNREAPDPGQVAGERGQILVAACRIGRRFGVEAADDLSEGPNRSDHLALRVGAALGKLDDEDAGMLDAMVAPIRGHGCGRR